MRPPSCRTWLGRWVAGAWLLILLSGSAAAQTDPLLAGRRLDNALRALQARGLRIIFTSELVTSDLRVEEEPRGRDLRERLVELLRPHGLGVVDGPGGTVLVVRDEARHSITPRAPPRAQPQPRPPAAVDPATPVSPIHVERVVVEAPMDLRSGSHPLPDRRLSSTELTQLGGYTIDDPLRAAQALAGVAAGDDFRNDLSVRGSLPRHANVIVDGVTVPWLRHAAEGRGDAGTVTMIGNDVVGEAALRVGGYARQDTSQIGPQLDLTLREGSRVATLVRATASTTGARTTAEGPIGGRGSWLVGARRSVVEWPVGRQDHERTVFGYFDVQSKLVFDLRPTDQLSATLVAGISNLERDDPRPAAMADGINRATLATMAWRSIVGSRTVLRHQVSVVTHRFVNQDNTGQPVNQGTDGAAAYRFDVTHPVAGALIESGLQVRRMRGTRTAKPEAIPYIAPVLRADVDHSWLERAAHASVRWQPVSRLTVAPGVRLSHSTLMQKSAWDRWLEAEWSIAPRWTSYGNAAVVHQFADLDATARWLGPIDLAPERARILEVGVSHQPTRQTRWRASVFARRERDLLWARDGWPRLHERASAPAGGAARFENALTGRARGLELTIERRSATGLSGSASYTYSIARYTDPVLRVAFDADRDQRHVVSASVAWPLPGRTHLGASFRAGSPMPVPGYLVARDGGLYLGDRPNGVRLPAYLRLDIRAERTFDAMRRRLTLFAEVLNLLGRANEGVAAGWLRPGPGGEVQGATERLYPRLATFGVRMGF